MIDCYDCFPRLSSPLWLGPSYLPPRPSFVTVRSKCLLFESVASYQANSFACPGDVFLVESAAMCVDGFSMVALDCGAVETHFVRPALSAEYTCVSGLLVLDLDSVEVRKKFQNDGKHGGASLGVSVPDAGGVRVPCKTARGPGCIPWNSSLRARLFSNLPVSKIHMLPASLPRRARRGSRRTWTCSSKAVRCLEANHVPPNCVLSCAALLRSLGAQAEALWNLSLCHRNHFVRCLLSSRLPQKKLSIKCCQTKRSSCGARCLSHVCRADPCLPGWFVHPRENWAEAYCWWLAHADLTGQSPDQAIRDVLLSGAAPAVVGPVTTAEDIQIAVTVLCRFYPCGLLILHRPAACCLLFLPDAATEELTYVEASRWLRDHPSTLCMLYTQPDCDMLGHYVACTVVRAKVPPASCCSRSFKPSPNKPTTEQMQGGTFKRPLPKCARTIDLESPSARVCIDLSSGVSDDSDVLVSEASVSPARPLSISPLSGSPAAHEFAQPVPGPITPHSSLGSRGPEIDAATENHEVESEQLTPLPWQPSIKSSSSASSAVDPQPSPSQRPGTVSPTLPFTLDLLVPGTWLDPLTPSSRRLGSLSPAWQTAEISSDIAAAAASTNLTLCDVCVAFRLSECFCLQQSAALPPELPWVPGCSCVGVYGVCMCGFVEQAQASCESRPATPQMSGAGRFPNLSASTSSIVLDLDSDLDMHIEQPACSPERRRSRSPSRPLPSVSRNNTLAASPTADQIVDFWRARQQCAEKAVASLYAKHLQADPRDTSALASLFHALPPDWPVQPHDFGLSLDLLFDDELELWRQRAVDSASFDGVIRDAWNRQLNVVKLLPFFLAVLCLFAEKAGIAREFIFGFSLLMAPWLCHRSMHVCFNPLKPEHEVRARLFVALVAESNCGKSPFFRQVVDAVFVTHDPNRPCLIDRFPMQFVAPSPDHGKDKTLFVQQCTNSDFARRMKATKGHLCWLSEEAWGALDVAWAKGKGRVGHTDRKVQHCYLQNTQNGNSYGPLSVNAEQFFVPTTNFAFFHAGQPKVIHDYWGQAFMKDCPFGGMGWEFRPTFLFPRDQPENDETMPHVTFSGAAEFLLDLFAHLCACYGQTLDSKGFGSSPIPVAPQAASIWSRFRQQAERDKDTVPACAAGAVGKHCFTTTSHITACHLLQEAFLDIKNGRNSNSSSPVPVQVPWPGSIRSIPPDLVLAAPEHLHLMVTGILTCFNEMKLPANERAGPPVLDELRSGRRPQVQDDQTPPLQTPDEKALGILLQRFQDQREITVTNCNQVLPRRLGFRSNQTGICRLFDLAASHHAGVRQGAPNANLRLQLTLHSADPSFRQRLNLQLPAPANGRIAPTMAGAGKRARKAPGPEPAAQDAEQRRPRKRRAGRNLDPEPVPNEAQPAQPAKKLEKEVLLEPMYILARPVTARAVEDALNAELQRQRVKVHEKQFHIKACAPPRKQKQSFQLRCNVCQHGTCTWRGSATLNPATFLLSSSCMAKGAHGQVKAAKAPSGRKAGQTGKHVFPIAESLVYEGNLDQESMAHAIEKHFAEKPLQSTLLVRCKPRKPTKKGPTCIFECKTHFHRVSQAKCSWGGAAQILTRPDGVRELRLRYHQAEMHAPHEVQLYGTLTWKQRQAAKRCPKKDTPSIAEAVHAIERANPENQNPKIKPGKLAGFAARFRKKLRPLEQEAPRNPGHVASDFEYCEDRCNASLGAGQGRLLPESPRITPSDGCLRVVNMRLSPEHVCVPLICPEMLYLTLSLVPKPWNLKASTDGTYRLLFDSYALLTFGLNVKNWSVRKDLGMYSFRSSFVPLGFALANKENDEAYTHLGSTLFATAQALQQELSADSILQWHGDMHLGIEAARKSLAPRAKRLSDWAHVTGATSQGPSGFHGLLSKELPPQAKATLLPFLLQFCRISKQLPALIFHVIWSAIFVEVERQCGASLVGKLQKQYFERVRKGVGVRWDASWRSAPDRIMPGTDAGSAPQESWHGQILKPVFGTQRRKPADVAQILQQQIVLPQLRTLRAMKSEAQNFQDWPGVGNFLDQHVLQGDVKLKKEGRTSGKSLLAWGLHTRYKDEVGNVWMLVPTSKFKKDWAASKKTIKYKDRVPVALPAHAVQHFATMITATSVQEVEVALSALGCFDLANHVVTDWRKLAKLFDDWRCVVTGQFTAELWQHHKIQDDADAMCSNKHALWLCFGCHVASVWGPCEHAYCCMEHEGHSSVIPVPKAKPKGRPSKREPKEPPAVPPQVVPGPCIAPSASDAAPHIESSFQPLSADHLALRALLRSASLGQFFQPMAQQGVTVPALRRFTYTDFFAFFRMSVGESFALMEALSTVPALEQASAG